MSIGNHVPDPTREKGGAPAAMRPTLTGTRHMVVAGHHVASHAAFEILEAGGNAVDAGVAAGLTMSVVQSEFVNFAGVAPMMIRMAETGEVITIDGLGCWPRAASLDHFVDVHAGSIPGGILRTVVPAAPYAWITALEKFGTATFSDVADTAIRVAAGGFVMYPLMSELIETYAAGYARWPANAEIYLPQGRAPRSGELFVQSDLAGTLQYMVDEELAAGGSREAGLLAARRAFYEGDIAKTICAYHDANGGWLTRDDLAQYRVEIEPALTVPLGDKQVYACGPWSQGPSLLMFLRLLANDDLAAVGHNSSPYIHTVTEAMKLGFADRERYFADPRYTEVPMARLLSDEYARERRQLIDPERAYCDLPPPGNLKTDEPSAVLDTSYVAVVDQFGNAFSCTPSDTCNNAPIIPGTGIAPSSRGSQSWAVRGHPSAVAPGRRPRLTPNPAMVVANEGKFVMPFGTPGGDVQTQAMLQTLLNLFVFDMSPQAAVEAPRFATYSFPASFEPHAHHPGRLNLEARIAEDVGLSLSAMGHDVDWWDTFTWRSGGMCLVAAELDNGVLMAAADPRRAAYALGW
jgi:gamma-glutamyltranspeptidase/glutathione hydrolase